MNQGSFQDGWEKRIATRPHDFDVLAKNAEDLLGKLPKKTIRAMVEKEQERLKRGTFGTFLNLAMKDPELITEWRKKEKGEVPTIEPDDD